MALTMVLGAAAVTHAETAAAEIAPLMRDHVVRRPARAAGVTLRRHVRHIVLIGDSIVFDHGLTGGRPNSIVALVNDVVHHRFPDVTVDDRAARGLSTLHAINPASPTLRPYLHALLDDATETPDLIVIAISAIDLNLFPDVPVTALWPALLVELEGVRDLVEARGAQVAFVPAFGASETMYEKYRSLAGRPVPPYPINHRIDAFNELLAGSGLPLLFRHFFGLDSDHDGDTDERLFFGHDVPGHGSPDDGVHPNGLGERVYADNLATALIAPLTRQMTLFAATLTTGDARRGDAHDERRRRHGRVRVDGATS